MAMTRPAARFFLQRSAIQQGDRLKEAEAQVSGGWGGIRLSYTALRAF